MFTNPFLFGIWKIASLFKRNLDSFFINHGFKLTINKSAGTHYELIYTKENDFILIYLEDLEKSGIIQGATHTNNWGIQVRVGQGEYKMPDCFWSSVELRNPISLGLGSTIFFDQKAEVKSISNIIIDTLNTNYSDFLDGNLSSFYQSRNRMIEARKEQMLADGGLTDQMKTNIDKYP